MYIVHVHRDQRPIMLFLLKFVSDWLLSICYPVHVQTTKGVVLLPPCCQVINPHAFYQNE